MSRLASADRRRAVGAGAPQPRPRRGARAQGTGGGARRSAPSASVSPAPPGAAVARGRGLHSGAEAELTLRAAPRGQGRYLVVYEALEGGGEGRERVVRCEAAAVASTTLSTALAGEAGEAVQTVEHLLSALEACGVADARLELRGGREVPLLDGSAAPWVEVVRQAQMGVFAAAGGDQGEGQAAGDQQRPRARRLVRPVNVHEGDAFVVAVPAQIDGARLSYGVDFPHLPAIGEQWFSLALQPGTAEAAAEYEAQVAPARTFTDEATVDALREAGLIAGGSLDNALVASRDGGWLNPDKVSDVQSVRVAGRGVRAPLSMYLFTHLLTRCTLPCVHRCVSRTQSRRGTSCWISSATWRSPLRGACWVCHAGRTSLHTRPATACIASSPHSSLRRARMNSS